MLQPLTALLLCGQVTPQQAAREWSVEAFFTVPGTFVFALQARRRADGEAWLAHEGVVVRSSKAM